MSELEGKKLFLVHLDINKKYSVFNKYQKNFIKEFSTYNCIR